MSAAKQLKLIYPDVPGWKRTDTSRAAAHSMRSRSGILKYRVMAHLAYLDSQGYGGATADEVAKAIGETEFSIRPRLSELCKLGSICDSGERRINDSGKKAIVWRLK